MKQENDPTWRMYKRQPVNGAAANSSSDIPMRPILEKLNDCWKCTIVNLAMAVARDNERRINMTRRGRRTAPRTHIFSFWKYNWCDVCIELKYFRLIQWIHSLVNTLIIGCYKKKENLTWRAPKWSLWTKGLLGSIDSMLPSPRGADNSPCGEVILVQPPSLHLV